MRIRERARRLLDLCKILVSDPRLPRPLRWMIRAGLAVKALPMPDFGVDEILLGTAALLLMTVYRSKLQEILAERKA